MLDVKCRWMFWCIGCEKKSINMNNIIFTHHFQLCLCLYWRWTGDRVGERLCWFCLRKTCLMSVPIALLGHKLRIFFVSFVYFRWFLLRVNMSLSLTGSDHSLKLSCGLYTHTVPAASSGLWDSQRHIPDGNIPVLHFISSLAVSLFVPSGDDDSSCEDSVCSAGIYRLSWWFSETTNCC